MLKIGDFSLLSKISIHMLRHYDEIGLLKPIHVDDFTNYRYYDEKQLSVANRIQSLKGMGLSLSTIKQILNEYGDTKALKTYLEIQAVQKQDELLALQEQISLIENAVKELENSENPKSCEIAIKEIPKRNVISCRKKLTWYSQEGQLWDILRKETNDMNVQIASPNYEVAVIHETDSDDMVDVEVQRAVVGTYPDTEHTKFKIVPATLVAALTCEGGYPQLQSINNELSRWILENGYELCGHVINIYHISPRLETNSDNMLTEVCFPIKRK